MRHDPEPGARPGTVARTCPRLAAILIVLVLPWPLRAGASADAPLQLPPFIVHDARFKLSLWSWGYMSFPGYEVLTGCGRGASNKFVMGAARQLSILHDIAPAAFEAAPAVPTSLILMNGEQAQAVSDDMKRYMAARPADVDIGASRLSERIVSFPQLRLHDTESTAISLVLRNPWGSDAVILQPGYVHYLMESRVPRLPEWYVGAMTDLYRNAAFSSSTGEADERGRLTLGSTSVTFSPIMWIGASDAAVLRDDGTLTRSLLPMGTLFFGPPPPRSPDEKRAARARLREAQSDLFLQWVVADKHRQRIAALKKFLDCCDTGRRDEAAFRECFGIGFTQMRDALADWLPTATERSITWYSSGGSLDETFRDATPAEGARIWGNWELMEIPFVRSQDPLMVYPYVDQAAHTLGDAYRKGAKDPGLLALLGLYETDNGDPGRARALLEAAAAASAAYPRAYTELARLRLSEKLASPKGAGGKPGADQIGAVLAPLEEARSLYPPQKATYLLFALALGNSSGRPAPADLAVLDEGLRLFPAESELATMVSALKDRRGANGLPAVSIGP